MRKLFNCIIPCWLVLLLTIVTMNSFADMEFTTIPLQHRQAEQLIPVLRPLLPADATITGSGYTLMVKTTPENLQELQQALTRLDTPLQQLVISVKTSGGRQQIQQAVISGQRGNISNRNQTQQIRTLEGSNANIQVGYDVPFITQTRMPNGTVVNNVTYQNFSTGFNVLPVLHGNQVELQLSQQAIENPHTMQRQQAMTSVSVPLGEWIQIGQISQTSNNERNNIIFGGSSHSDSSISIYVKVDR